MVAPTDKPRKMVAAFMIPLEAALNKREVLLPISLIKLPNINIPTNDTASGTMIATIVVTVIGKRIFNTRMFLNSCLLGYNLSCSFMLIFKSFSEQVNFTTNGMITGTKAMYEYAAMAIGPNM